MPQLSAAFPNCAEARSNGLASSALCHYAALMPRTGSASLPLHGGHVPPWLAQRMTRLGRIITEAIVLHYGADEFLRRIAHPFWFQSFGAVMGMDWHSSGITTSVLGSLKRGLAPVSHELGLYVCGGRGNASRRTPDELRAVAETTGLDGAALSRASRLVAKVDSAAIQDGYSLYLHGFIVSKSGSWTVVQQGMHEEDRLARRYHWLSDDVKSFVEEPHAAIEGSRTKELLLNMTDARARASKAAQLVLLQRPDRVLDEVAKLRQSVAEGAPSTASLPHLDLPDHHDVRRDDVSMRRLGATLLAAAESAPDDYESLLLTKGVGARTVFALANVAEVIHGAPSRFSDPARFSLAHGGKDGFPYAVPLKVYDETLRVLKDAVSRAKLGNEDRLSALRALDDRARALEPVVRDVDFEGLLQEEHAKKEELGGRTVMDDARETGERRSHLAYSRKRSAPRSVAPTDPRQLRLFRG